MPSPFDPTNPPDKFVTFYTFQQWEVKADPTTAQEQRDNLIRINAAIEWSAFYRVPVVGLGKSYTIAQTNNTDQIVLRTGSTVICEPGCAIKYAYKNNTTSVVGSEANLQDATWRGGTFVGVQELSTGQYPVGNVFDLTGSRLNLHEIGVEGFRSGKAFVLSGDDIVLRNPRVSNPAGVLDTGGIHYRGGSVGSTGKNFRCENPTVNVTGDAFLLGSGTVSTSIKDVTCLGLSGSSSAGSVLAIEAQDGAIDTVRIDGLNAQGGTTGNVVRIKNQGSFALTNVAVRNAVVKSGSSTVDAVSILNTGTEAGTLSAIMLENFAVFMPPSTTTAVAFRVNAAGSIPLPVDGVRWTGGGVRPLTANNVLSAQYVVLRRANNIQLVGLRLDGSNVERPVVIGDGGECRSVVLGDVAITRIAGQTGTPTLRAAVTFDRAVNCGMVRGAVGAVSGSGNAFAAKFMANADNCYVEDVDMTGIINASGPLIDVATTKPYRLVNNAVATSQAPQRSPLELGPPVAVPLTNNWVSLSSSFVVLNPSPNTTLNTIRTATTAPAGRSLEGDILVLMAAAGQTVQVNDGAGNIQLQTTAGSIQLNGTNADTLTLLCRGLDWVQVAYSKNG